MNNKKERAVFLDRDGVINDVLFFENIGLLETPFHPKHFQLKKNVPAAIRKINRLGFKVIIVSNQPGIAMKHFSRKTLDQITQKMVYLLKKEKASIDGIYYCLHHPTKGKGKLKTRCTCRKPKPGLLLKAAKDFKIDLKKSFMVGDSITDVIAGQKAGCQSILLAHLKCDLCHLMSKRKIKPDYLVPSFTHAVKTIEKLIRK